MLLQTLIEILVCTYTHIRTHTMTQAAVVNLELTCPVVKGIVPMFSIFVIIT